MNPNKRIIINTGAQYLKATINICLSLYSTRIILEALDVNDYGTYAAVGGIVAMLGFITNALIITTQRYLSYHFGKNDTLLTKKIFANSLFLHIIIGLALLTALCSVGSLVMNHFINIPEGRQEAANIVYYITAVMLFITIVTAPFKALFVARENIIYVSIVDVVDSFLKLAVAFILLSANIDKLILYATLMATIQLCNFIAYSVYGNFKYEEACHLPPISLLDKKVLLLQAGFAGWMTFGTGSLAARNQGAVVLLNNFYGAAMNAALSLGFQIYSSMSFVATSILNAMNPQIMRAEGAGDRERALTLAMRESKFAVALMLSVSIPVIMEMPSLLELWLVKVPKHTCMFCTVILVSFLCDQLTAGLNTINQALGHIRNYSLMVYLPKLLALPLYYLVLILGGGAQTMMMVYFGVELIVALGRIPFTAHSAGLDQWSYIRNVFIPLAPLAISLLVVSYMLQEAIEWRWRFVITFALSFLVSAVTGWFFTLNKDEKVYIAKLIKERVQ